jgi:precorrin-2 dehydrogenase / sirohydrochlorin ferrochelatase
MLDLNDVPCLVVGAGPVATRKARELVVCGARVTVISPEVSPEMQALAVHAIHTRSFQPGDTAGFHLVMTATNHPAVNAAVAAEARSLGQWINSADDPANCSFILPALLRRGPLTVAVSTAGSSPALAGWLRDRLSEAVGPEFATAAETLAAERAAIHEDGQTTEGLDWLSRIRELLGDTSLGRGESPSATHEPVAPPSLTQ